MDFPTTRDNAAMGAVLATMLVAILQGALWSVL